MKKRKLNQVQSLSFIYPEAKIRIRIFVPKIVRVRNRRRKKRKSRRNSSKAQRNHRSNPVELKGLTKAGIRKKIKTLVHTHNKRK
jgi:hypothetical protein